MLAIAMMVAAIVVGYILYGVAMFCFTGADRYQSGLLWFVGGVVSFIWLLYVIAVLVAFMYVVYMTMLAQ